MSNNKMKNLYISAASISNDESPKPEYLQCFIAHQQDKVTFSFQVW